MKMSSQPKLNRRQLMEKSMCQFTMTGVYVLPLYILYKVLSEYGCPNWIQLAFVFPMGMFLIGIAMSVCLHRYFSHFAFKTTRSFQFVLGVLACMAYQRGPVWWASKHRRHHKFCDKPEDPHSWTQTNFLYAWIGWTSFESHTDDEFVTKLMTYPEMLVLDWLWMFPMMLTHLAIYKALGPQWMICLATMPMLISNLVTLLFNVEFHPQHKTDDVCKALDNPRFLSELVGESYHEDHHSFPTKAHRPGLDLPFWLFIRPLAATGLIWRLR